MVNSEYRLRPVYAVFVSCMLALSACGGQDDQTDVVGDTADALVDDIVTSDELAVDTAEDTRDTSEVMTDSTGLDTSLPDIIETPDNLVDTDFETDDGVCFPDCGSVKCGMDPVCGLQDCGTCDSGSECVSGQCIKYGCNHAVQDVCHDGFDDGQGPAIVWSEVEAQCVAAGGTWQACPKDDILVSVTVRNDAGQTFSVNYYFGLYCSAAEAMGEAIVEFGDDLLTVDYQNDDLKCGNSVTDSVGCVVTNGDEQYCVELAGAIPLEKALSFGVYCEDAMDGVSVESCPTSEMGNCEVDPTFDGGWYTLMHYYSLTDLVDEQASCTSNGGQWLETECQIQDEPYGDCTLQVRTCGYEGGDYQQMYYEAWVSEPVAGTSGHACCFASASEAYDPAFLDLLADDDLARCQPECVPDCSDMACGLDPVCGTSCGTCDVQGEACVSGQCVVPGCNYAPDYVCLDGWLMNDSSAPDLAALQAECESGGGTWGTCPVDGRLLTQTLHVPGLYDVDQHLYLGKFCSSTEAIAWAAANTPSNFAAETRMYNEELVCGAVTQNSIACYVVADLLSSCEEMTGGIGPERATAFSAYCVSRLGGSVRSSCPASESGLCEQTIGWRPDNPKLTHYYGEYGLSGGQTECSNVGGNWILTECETGDYAYGSCTLPYKTCRHPAGASQSEYYEMWLTDSTVPVTTYVCCYAAAADAIAPAVASLADETDLSGCSD